MPIISIREWLHANKRTRVLPTDKWYIDFAGKVLPLIQQSPLFNKTNMQKQCGAALAVSMYFQDAIAQSGGWKVFSDSYFKQYHAPLPFYPTTEEYVPDEINSEDIAFILWTYQSSPADNHPILSPCNAHLLALSQALYEQMDNCFEEAPVSTPPSSANWIMDIRLLKTPSTPLPEITTKSKLTKNAERCLSYNQGRPLIYIADYKELCHFFTEVLKWENQPSALLPELQHKKEFVIYANAKGMLIAHGVAAYFKEVHNPLYDAQRAAAEGYNLFCHPGVCPFDLLKYGMYKDILPDVQLPFPGGKELLHQYWDFIARYYLCEYYEGE